MPLSDDSTGPNPGCRESGPPRPSMEVLNRMMSGFTAHRSS